MGILILELGIFALNIWNAIVNRGTIWGWISVAIICWYVYTTVKTINEG